MERLSMERHRVPCNGYQPNGPPADGSWHIYRPHRCRSPNISCPCASSFVSDDSTIELYNGSNMSDPIVEKGPARGGEPVQGEPDSLPSQGSFNEKSYTGSGDENTGKGGILSAEITDAPRYRRDDGLCDTDSENVVIITGADAAAHLLPMRDDGEPALTFRSLFLASSLACFQAVMSQIYQVGPAIRTGEGL